MTKSNTNFMSLRRLFLRLALGKRTYDYMSRSVHHDPRTHNAKTVDIVVRKDGTERRLEADWIKNIARIVPKPDTVEVGEMDGLSIPDYILKSPINGTSGRSTPSTAPELDDELRDRRKYPHHTSSATFFEDADKVFNPPCSTVFDTPTEVRNPSCKMPNMPNIPHFYVVSGGVFFSPQDIFLLRHGRELEKILSDFTGSKDESNTWLNLQAAVASWLEVVVAKKEIFYNRFEHRWQPTLFKNDNRPHCDQDVLHAPKTCTYCDEYAEGAQQDRLERKINFTGEQREGFKPCPSDLRRGRGQAEQWVGNKSVK